MSRSLWPGLSGQQAATSDAGVAVTWLNHLRGTFTPSLKLTTEGHRARAAIDVPILSPLPHASLKLHPPRSLKGALMRRREAGRGAGPRVTLRQAGTDGAGAPSGSTKRPCRRWLTTRDGSMPNACDYFSRGASCERQRLRSRRNGSRLEGMQATATERTRGPLFSQVIAPGAPKGARRVRRTEFGCP